MTVPKCPQPHPTILRAMRRKTLRPRHKRRERLDAIALVLSLIVALGQVIIWIRALWP